VLGELPTLVIFYNEDSEPYLDLITFPNVERVKVPRRGLLGGYFGSFMLRKNLFHDQAFIDAKIESVYPANDLPLNADEMPYRCVSWYPDLQHCFHPEYFTRSNLFLRERRLKCLLKNTHELVVSSQDVASHFERFYDMAKVKMTVMPFVSLVDVDSLPTSDDVFRKYEINEPYFMVSNQFYRHKDHLTLIRAVNELRKSGVTVCVLMTGKMEDYRDPDYIHSLKKAIEDFGIEDSIQMLGVIPRADQLSLLKSSLSVIQPSLFEGWSTVVEDAKALGSSIIASGIPIHKEQLDGQGILYLPQDHVDLANKMRVLQGDPNAARLNFDYNENIVTLSNSFESIMLCN
jgi:glycosyltransferase involved in cell wall biosynthesis